MAKKKSLGKTVRGWFKEPARHSLASRGKRTKKKPKPKKQHRQTSANLRYAFLKPRLLKFSKGKKPKITFLAHDWAEIKYKGKKYEFEMNHDFHYDPEQWDAEVKRLTHMDMSEVADTYGLTAGDIV